jgi:tetratricopeptide (TPR) repeat protein
MGIFNKKEKSYQEIVEEINSNLGENKEKNRVYLKKQINKYKHHSMKHEIIKEIGRMMARNLDEEQVKKINNAIEKDITIHFESGVNYIKSGELDKAEEELKKYVRISEQGFKDDNIYKYFTPKNPIEYMLILKDEKEREIKEIGMDFSSGYTYLSVIAVEKRNFKKAREMLEKAFKWNPYNAEAIFEYCEIYKIEGNLEEYKNKTMQAFSKLYHPIDLARFYRNLGYYYIEREEWELAKAIYIYSMKFGQNEIAQNELIYIMQKTNNEKLPDINEVKGIIERYYIPTKISEENLTIIENMLKNLIKDKQEKSNFGQYLKSLKEFYQSL